MNFGPSITLVNCQLVGNRALMLGGGLYNYEGAATLANCRIVGNMADYADITGGAAIYNLNGSLTVLDCTIADNRSPEWPGDRQLQLGNGPAVKVKVVNSILFNGGDEVWSNVRDAWLKSLTVTCRAAGPARAISARIRSSPGPVRWSVSRATGWTATIGSRPPRRPSTRAAARLCRPTVLIWMPTATSTESLPFDLDNETRIEGTRVDMGAYEQLAKKPTPTPTANLTVSVGDGYLTLHPDPNAPSSSNTYLAQCGCHIELNFQGQLGVTVTSQSAAGGRWSGWVIPDTIGPGEAVVTLWVKGENLNLAALPAGAQEVLVAAVDFFVVPVQ